MPDGHGQVIVRVASVREFDEDDEDYWSNRPAVAWVQGTDLGVDVVADATSQHVWVTDLATGTPIDGVTVGDTTTGDTVTTDANGLAVLDLPGQSRDDGYAVTATRDGDVAVLPGYRVATPETAARAVARRRRPRHVPAGRDGPDQGLGPRSVGRPPAPGVGP